MVCVEEPLLVSPFEIPFVSLLVMLSHVPSHTDPVSGPECLVLTLPVGAVETYVYPWYLLGSGLQKLASDHEQPNLALPGQYSPMLHHRPRRLGFPFITP